MTPEHHNRIRELFEPATLSIAFVARRTKNTWAACIGHTVGNIGVPVIVLRALLQVGREGDMRTMNEFNRLLAVAGVITAAGLLAACTAAESETDGKADLIRALIADARASAPYPALAVSVRRGEELIYEAGHGKADLEHGAEATPNTVFQIGSITKSFTAILVAQLAAEERIDLAAPVRDYLPDYAGPAGDVPVRFLMNHTAGLVNYTDLPAFPHGSRKSFTRDEMRSYFEGAELMYEPGLAFTYSNSGTYTLGLIVEAVTGESYETALQEQILEPLGLDRTYFGDWRPVVEGRAEGYVVGDDGFENAPQLDPLIPFAAGALLSTVQDLQAYIDQVHRKNALGDEVRDILYTRETLTNGIRVDYALGALVIREWEGRQKIAHAGDIDGFSSYMAYYPDDDVSIVVMANARDVVPTPVGLEQKLARIVFDAPRTEPLAEPLETVEIESLAGDYDAGYMRIGIDRVGILPVEGGIAVRFDGVEAGGPTIPLIHLEGRRFLAAHDDEMMFTFSPGEGVARDVVVDWLGGGIPFSRSESGGGS